MTKEDALRAIAECLIHPGQLWRHQETGNVYTIVALALREETLDPVVVYAGDDGVVWVRRLDVFMGQKNDKPRFLEVVQ